MAEALRVSASEAEAGAARRLAPYIVLAVFLHGLAVVGLRLPDPAETPVPPPLRLSWRTPSSPASVPQPVQQPVPSSERVRASDARGSHAASAAEPVRVQRAPVSDVFVPAAVQPPVAVPAAEAARPPVTTDLLEGARRMARDIGRETVRDGVSGSSTASAGRGAPVLVERAALPELDRALHKRSAGEERLGGGILRITTESGRVYCLKPSSDLVRDGPVEPLAVPTNCP